MRDSNSGSFARFIAGFALISAIAPPSWSADGADAGAGRAKATQCFACHGSDGVAKVPDAPNLAGQNESYLVKALNDYKSGARKHEIMSMMARNLSDADIKQLASFYSGIPVTVKAP
jgi:cytochrome c553